VKRVDLIRKLEKTGYILVRNGKHKIYAKLGARPVQVPHGKEINKFTTEKILKHIGVR